MNTMNKIAVLDNLFQAQMLESMLKEKGIPHTIRSHADLVLDGLFEGSQGWGHVEAAEEHRTVILAALQDLKNANSTNTGPA
jgi:hypothetical protein